MKKHIITALFALTVLAGCKKDTPTPEPDKCPYVAVTYSRRVYSTANGLTSFKEYYYMNVVKDKPNWSKEVEITFDQYSTYKSGQELCDFKP